MGSRSHKTHSFIHSINIYYSVLASGDTKIKETIRGLSVVQSLEQ